MRPGLTIANQPHSLPLPFPIREPLTLRVMGRWGKKLNHIRRLVLSDRRAARRIWFHSRETTVSPMNKGWLIRTPLLPNIRLEWVEGFIHVLFFCLFLNTNLRGWKVVTCYRRVYSRIHLDINNNSSSTKTPTNVTNIEFMLT